MTEIVSTFSVQQLNTKLLLKGENKNPHRIFNTINHFYSRLMLCLSYLDEHLAQEGHDKGRVHAAEASDCADGQLSDLKHLIVQSNKQRLQVLSLGEVGVETLIKRCQHTVSNVWICKRTGGRKSPTFNSLITFIVITFTDLDTPNSMLNKSI